MSKTTVKITGTEQVKKSTTAFLKTLVDDDLILNELGQLTADQIRARVRSKGRVDDEYKQPDLNALTIEVRKILEDVDHTDTLYSSKRSNVTFTGQLLDSIKHKINKTTGQVSLYLSDYRTPKKTLSKTEARERYYQYLDIDHNSGNSLRSTFDIKTKKEIRSGPDFKLKMKALFIAAHKADHKGNNKIKDELEKKGFRFFFVSTKLQILLENKIAQSIRRKLATFNAIIRK